jgi:hypothetical protein
MIAATRPSALIRRRQYCIDLYSTQKRYQSTSVSFSWDGQQALDLCGMRRCFEGHVAEKRANGGQTQVARSGRHIAGSLQFVEELDHKRCVDVIDRQCRWRSVQPPLGKLQQQPKRVAVGGNRVGARLTLLHQPLCEVPLQQRGKSWLDCHDGSPQRRSRRAMACAISSGESLRYQ